LDKTTSTLEEDHIKKGDDNETMCKGLPLNTEQMEALISLLQLAVTESIHHNPTFGLIKAIASRRYASASFYDLMDTILKLSVQSQKSTVRQVSFAIKDERF
jgi:U3 small nucleolar RNA-associated protein 20